MQKSLGGHYIAPHCHSFVQNSRIQIGGVHLETIRWLSTSVALALQCTYTPFSIRYGRRFFECILRRVIACKHIWRFSWQIILLLLMDRGSLNSSDLSWRTVYQEVAPFFAPRGFSFTLCASWSLRIRRTTKLRVASTRQLSKLRSFLVSRNSGHDLFFGSLVNVL